MKCIAAIGRLEADTWSVGDDHNGWERFVAPRIEERMPLLDGHYGRPLAFLTEWWRGDDGTYYGEFAVRRGREAEVRALEGQPLSIEFTGTRLLERDRALDGSSVMMHRGAVIRGIAAVGDGEPARRDARLVAVVGAAPEVALSVRSRTEPPMPKAIQDRLAGRTITQSYGGSIIR